MSLDQSESSDFLFEAERASRMVVLCRWESSGCWWSRLNHESSGCWWSRLHHERSMFLTNAQSVGNFPFPQNFKNSVNQTILKKITIFCRITQLVFQRLLQSGCITAPSIHVAELKFCRKNAVVNLICLPR